MEKTTFKEITLMNALLCFSVVMIHLTSAPVGQLTYGSFWHIIIFMINKALCFSVPAFIFLSGFKLYNKFGDSKIDLKKFFVGRVKKIVVPYIICVLVYFLYFFNKEWVSVKDLPQYIFLGTLVAHCYYVVIAVQAYVLFPVLKTIFHKYPKQITIVSLICMVFCLEFLHFTYSDRFIGTYIFYFVLGMFFAKYRLYEKMNKLHLISIIGVMITGIIHLCLSYMATGGELVYRCANIVNLLYVTLSIIAIYGLCIKLSEKCSVLYKGAQMIGHISYNVYLYHILIIFILQYDIFPNFNLSVRNRFAISFTVVYSLILLYGFLNSKMKRAAIGRNRISQQ